MLMQLLHRNCRYRKVFLTFLLLNVLSRSSQVTTVIINCFIPVNWTSFEYLHILLTVGWHTILKAHMYHLSLWNYFRYKVDQCSRYQNIVTTSRNSHLRCFLKKGVLWNFAKFTGINKVAGLKFLRIPFLQNISGRLLLNCFLKIFKTSIVSCRFLPKCSFKTMASFFPLRG